MGTVPLEVADQSKKTQFLVIALAALVLAVGLIWFLSNGTLKPGAETDDGMPVRPAALDSISGYVYFADDEPDTRRSVIKRFDIETGEVVAVLNEPLYYYRSPVIVETGEGEIVLGYLRAPYDPDSEWALPYTEYLEVVVTDASGTTRVVSSADVREQRNLTWSSAANSFAFDGLSQAATRNQAAVDHSDLSNWSVYILPLDGGEPTEIERAIYPQWSEDGEYLFFYQGADLVRYDVVTENIDVVLAGHFPELSIFDSFVFTNPIQELVVSERFGGGVHTYSVTNQGTKYAASFPREAYAYSLSALPDGLVMYWILNSSNTAEVYIYDPQLNQSKNLFSVPIQPPHGVAPAWSDLLYEVP